MSSTISLSSHLLSQHDALYKSATQATFLHLAGHGKLPPSTLSQWLTQDRLYAQMYIRFSGLLLANIRLPRKADNKHLDERLVDCLIGALANVKRELGFFEKTAREYGLELTMWGKEGQGLEGKIQLEGFDEGTKGYAKLFEKLGTGVENGNMTQLECFVLLWGMEKCYLEAWRYAKSFFDNGSGSAETDLDKGALRREFVPNWTGDEFVVFVDDIEQLMQELWERDGKEVGLEKLESVWLEVLDVESAFWPAL